MGTFFLPMTERNALIMEDIKTMSLGEVAAKYDITLQRVHQILQANKPGGVGAHRTPMNQTKGRHESQDLPGSGHDSQV